MQLIFNNHEVFSEVAKLRIFPHKQQIVLLRSVRKKGFIPLKKEQSVYLKSEIERIAISRAKSKISDYALCNNFNYFYTQTMNNNYDRYNLNEFKKILLKKFKAYKRINKEFKYLIIFEKHKNGAFHCHGLLSGINENDLIAGDNDYLNIKFFNDLGLNSIQKIRSIDRVSTYITKYMTKEFIKTDSNVSYFHSKGLKLPIEKEITITDFSKLVLVFSNEYIKRYEFK